MRSRLVPLSRRDFLVLTLSLGLIEGTRSSSTSDGGIVSKHALTCYKRNLMNVFTLEVPNLVDIKNHMNVARRKSA